MEKENIPKGIFRCNRCENIYDSHKKEFYVDYYDELALVCEECHKEDNEILRSGV